MQEPQTLNPSFKGPRASPVIRNLGGGGGQNCDRVSGCFLHLWNTFRLLEPRLRKGALFHEISCLSQVHGLELRTVRRFLLLATLASPAYPELCKARVMKHECIHTYLRTAIHPHIHKIALPRLERKPWRGPQPRTQRTLSSLPAEALRFRAEGLEVRVVGFRALGVLGVLGIDIWAVSGFRGWGPGSGSLPDLEF